MLTILLFLACTISIALTLASVPFLAEGSIPADLSIADTLLARLQASIPLEWIETIQVYDVLLHEALIIILFGAFMISLSVGRSRKMLLDQANQQAASFEKISSELEAANSRESLARRQAEELEASTTTLQVQVQTLEASLSSAEARLIETAHKGNRDEQLDQAVIHFLSLLQEKGRFIDFVMDDVTAYGDAQVGAAARVVHQGCQRLLKEYLSVQPVHPGTEGQSVNLAKDFSASNYRLVGNVSEQPPYKGTLLHKGWKVEKVTLPRKVATPLQPVPGDAGLLIAPAEVEIR